MTHGWWIGWTVRGLKGKRQISLETRQNQSACHPFIIVTCGHINTWRICTHTHTIHWSSHEPPPYIHMLVSKPVGQHESFLPASEGCQAGVYVCMCVSLYVLMHGCLCIQKGRIWQGQWKKPYTQPTVYTLVGRQSSKRDKSFANYVFLNLICRERLLH